jgi:lipoprotein-releasing system permease protein
MSLSSQLRALEEKSFSLWLVLRYMRLAYTKDGVGLTLTTMLSLVGMALGVGTLVLTMSVWSGVDRILRDAIIDLNGHVQVLKNGGGLEDPGLLQSEIEGILKRKVLATPFLQVEALLTGKGSVVGVQVQGVEPTTVESVLKISSRVTEGAFDLESDGEPAALLGKELAKRFKLKVGDEVRLVVAKSSFKSATGFVPRSKKFRLVGILDLGKYEFNSRVVVTSASAAQSLAGIPAVFTGLRLRLKSDEEARPAAHALSSSLGYGFWTKDWFEVNENYFSAIELEKRVIFFVLCFMVVVASFNISSTMFVNVLRRFSDIATLQTLGAGRNQLIRIFLSHGILVGLVGTLSGVVLGLLGGFLVSHMATLYIPAEIYKFDRLPMEVRWLDLLAIIFTSLLICAAASWFPARKGASLKPIEGLRYE